MLVSTSINSKSALYSNSSEFFTLKKERENNMGRNSSSTAESNQSHHDEQQNVKSPRKPKVEQTQMFPPQNPAQVRSAHVHHDDHQQYEEEEPAVTQMYPPPPPKQAQVRPGQGHYEGKQEKTMSYQPAHRPMPGYPGQQPMPAAQYRQTAPPTMASQPPHRPMPGYYPGQQPMFTKRWSSGLFDCVNDPNNAVATVRSPCVTFGRITEIVDQGQTPCMTSAMFYVLFSLITIIPFYYSSMYRTKIRVKYGLVEESGPDCLIHLCCHFCALCQEYRELQAQGLDPSVGWTGNVHLRQQQQMNMMPPSQQRMQG